MKKLNQQLKTTRFKDKVINFIFVIVAVIYGTLLSQHLKAQNANIGETEMLKLSNWVGEWEGEGWSTDESRQRVEFTIKEHIQSKLGGKAFLIEGFGKSKIDGKSVHTAMAMLYFNKDKNVYEMKSLIDRGMVTLAEAKIDEEGNFVWGFAIQGGRIKYTIKLTENTWNESGAFVTEGGQEFPIMEMNLTKVK